MNKEEFLRQLEELLSDIPQEEKHDALEYYRDFFEDATKDEKEIIEELGSPLNVAKTIRQGIYGDTGASTVKHQMEEYGKKEDNERQNQQEYKKETVQKEKNNSKWILILILACFTAPIWIGAVSALGGIALAITICLITIPFVLLVVSVATIFAGIGLIAGGIATLISGAGVMGIGVIAAGCITLAIGLLAVVLFILYTFKFLPWLLREIVHLIQRIFKRKEV